MDKLFESDVFGVAELAAASGATKQQIELWCRVGIIIPHKDASGFGTRRLYRGIPTILDGTEARDLTAAGYSTRQIRRRFAIHRAALAGLAPADRDVERFRRYIATITELASLFGKGPGFDAWLTTQTAQLRRMERTAATARGTGREDDVKLLNQLAALRAEDGPQALAG